MKVLVINCGSSSLKYQVLDMTNESLLCKGLVERIGMEGSVITHEKTGCDKFQLIVPMEDHKDAISHVLMAIQDADHGVVKDMSEIGAVGHRVVHAGEKFAHSVLIDDAVIKALEECIELAPLHNPPNLLGIAACQELMPDTPMVGVFDTAFHQTMPPESYIYALPYEYYEKYGVRRYGFHGTSHKYVSERAVVMGTRSGDIDPAIVTFIREKEGLEPGVANEILNKKSGVLGISGVSSDFRDIEAAAEEGNERAMLALKVFAHNVRFYIGAYIAEMNGVDAIVFTAGVGENDISMRDIICNDLGNLGIKLDVVKNKVRGKEMIISREDSKVKVLLIPTNEELAICRETVALV